MLLIRVFADFAVFLSFSYLMRTALNHSIDSKA